MLNIIIERTNQKIPFGMHTFYEKFKPNPLITSIDHLKDAWEVGDKKTIELAGLIYESKINGLIEIFLKWIAFQGEKQKPDWVDCFQIESCYLNRSDILCDNCKKSALDSNILQLSTAYEKDKYGVLTKRISCFCNKCLPKQRKD